MDSRETLDRWCSPAVVSPRVTTTEKNDLHSDDTERRSRFTRTIARPKLWSSAQRYESSRARTLDWLPEVEHPFSATCCMTCGWQRGKKATKYLLGWIEEEEEKKKTIRIRIDKIKTFISCFKLKRCCILIRNESEIIFKINLINHSFIVDSN